MAPGNLELLRVKLDLLMGRFVSNMKAAGNSVSSFDQKLNKQINVLQRTVNIQKKLNHRTQLLKERQNNFGQVMAMNQDRFKQFNQSGLQFNKVSGKLGNSIRKATGGLEGFKMEMLGIMFFGMAIQRIFGGLTRTSLEWFGVFDVFSAALGLLFMPIAEKLLEWALVFLDWVDNLTPKQKEMVNLFVAIAVVIGTILAIVGTLALGIGSLIAAFGGIGGIGAIFTTLGTIITTVFAALTAPVLLIIGLIIAIVIGMAIAWKENFLGMRTIVAKFIEGVKLIFGGLWKVIKGILLILKGLFLGDFTLIKDGVKLIFEGLKNIIVGIIQTAISLVIGIIVGLIRIVWGVAKSIWGGFKWAGNKIIDFFKNIGPNITKSLSRVFVPDWLRFLVKGGISVGGKLKSVLGFAKGGIVPGPRGAPMPAIVHGGERIIPTGESGSSGSSNVSIIVNASIGSDFDVRRLAEQLKRYWVEDFERSAQGRGI